MIVEIKKMNNGDHYIELPNEMIEEMGLQEGDLMEWIDNQNGSYTLKKVDDKEEETQKYIERLIDSGLDEKKATAIIEIFNEFQSNTVIKLKKNQK